MEKEECKIEKENLSLFNFTFSYFQLYSWILFLLVLTYLLLRAAFLEPLHDESATFLFFIEPECVVCDGIIQDANNHLLNSYIGTAIYHFFGEDLFLLRLPNVACFALYFWGIFTLVKPIRVGYYRIILLTALTTVAYMDEYFAYTRGYGMAISFFIWMLIYSKKWLHDPTIRNAALIYFFSLMVIFANLTFLVSGCLAICMVGLVHLKEIRKWKLLKQLIFFILHVAFLTALYPFVWFSYMLKTGGALYYGSLTGFWEVTVKTLSRYVLFYDADWQKWLWLGLTITFLVWLIYRFAAKGFWKELKSETSVFSWYFFGNIAAIFILAKILGVNYPEDRAAMYLIPLAMLIFGFTILKSPRLQPCILLFLFFPATFVLKMNLDTSVFSPDDRLNNALYAAVKKELKPGTTLAVYPLLQLNWSLSERKFSSEMKFQPDVSRHFSPLYDIIVNKKYFLRNIDLQNYELLYDDQPSGNVAYRRKFPLERTLLKHFEIPGIESDSKEIGLLEINLLDFDPGIYKMLSFSGNFQIEKPFRTVQVFMYAYNARGEMVRKSYFDQRWPHGKNKLNFDVAINHVLSGFSGEETKLRLYIWNPERSRISFRNGKTDFYKIKT